MNHEQKLQFVRIKMADLVPEIREQLQRIDIKYDCTLEDVLWAMNTPENCDYLIDSAGCFWLCDDAAPKLVGPLGKDKIQWHMGVPLHLQSEPTLNFLYDIFSK